MKIIGQALALPGRIVLAVRTRRLRRKQIHIESKAMGQFTERCRRGFWGTGYLARLRGKLGASKTS